MNSRPNSAPQVAQHSQVLNNFPTALSLEQFRRSRGTQSVKVKVKFF